MLENKLAKMPLANWGGLSFKCRCGARHEINVKEIVLRDDACSLISYFAKKMGRVLHIVYEKSVCDAAREKVGKKLDKSLYFTESFLPDTNLLSVKQCDAVLSEAREDVKVIVCVGGANAAEYGKYASAKSNAQWIFVNILPDGDNFASNYAMLWQDGVKRMFGGRAPDVILCDMDLAFKLSVDRIRDGLSLVYRNMLVVFDNNFAVAVQGCGGCGVINFILTAAVRDAVALSAKPYGKNKVKELFTCLTRISLAKSMAKVNMEYLTGAHSLAYILQTKYPEYSEARLAACVFDVLTNIYRIILTDDVRLSCDKDRLAHSQAIKKHFGLDIDSAYQYNADDDAYRDGRAGFLKNIEVVAKVATLAKSCMDEKPLFDGKTAEACLKTASDVYVFDGLLSYANDKGLFDFEEA